jgi:hypothetical protein
MTGPRGYERAQSISLDFDGVLSTLVLGRAWEKTREPRKRIPLFSPFVQGLKTVAAGLTEGFRRPFPQAEDALRGLRASQRILYLLTSRTGERRFFNLDGEDADRFKARILRSTGIDVHIDDDRETLSYLSKEFPERLFVHMNCYGRKSPVAGNIVVARSWAEIPGIFGLIGACGAAAQA